MVSICICIYMYIYVYIYLYSTEELTCLLGESMDALVSLSASAAHTQLLEAKYNNACSPMCWR